MNTPDKFWNEQEKKCINSVRTHLRFSTDYILWAKNALYNSLTYNI
jgi:hypothetical protein